MFARFRLFVMVTGLAFAASAVAQGPDAEVAKLQGVWVCMATLKDGKKTPTYVGVKATFKGNELTWHFPQKDGTFREQKNKYRIDAAKSPMHFDWWREDKTEANADLRIYSIDGDTMRMGTNLDGKTRPKSFETAVWQFTVKRVRETK